MKPANYDLPELSETDFITLIIALTKDGRIKEAERHIFKRIGEGERNAHIHSLGGIVKATKGDFEASIPCFLYAYAATRNPFYLRQLEEVLPKYYPEHIPFVLNSMDFVSFFKERGAKIENVELTSVRKFPDLKSHLTEVFPSTLFEEMFADRGLWCAEDKELEVIYGSTHHSVPMTERTFLMDKMHEIPPCPSDLFPGVSTTEGTLGIQSVHIGTRSILCRKSMLPMHVIDEECVYIGGSSNVGHFLLDFLPKAEIWSAIRKDRNLPIYTYNISGFCHEMTEALYPELRFVDLSTLLPEQALIRFRHVHVPSYVTAGFAFPALRSNAERNGHTNIENSKGDLIYLSRGEQYRRITNEAELTEKLEALGFKVINTMETSFSDIIAIMANARLIVGGYGAHTSYVVFCRPSTTYIELLPDVYLDGKDSHFNDRLYAYSHIKREVLRCPTEFAGRVGHRTDFKFNCDVDTVRQVVWKSAANLDITLNEDIALAR